MSKFYITSAIPYPNGKPHLGFAFELLLTDVLARYHRLIGDETHFLTGTDEHGLKVFQSAKKEGITFQEYVDRNSKEFAKLKEVLNISYDDFIRTTDQRRHWPGAIKFWEECLKRGKIYKKKYKGFYCIGCEEFKNPKDLINGLCPEHKTKPEEVEEENYFFKLTEYKDQIREIIESGELEIIPISRKNEVLSILKTAEDFSISRPRERISWGIPVPGDDSQTQYVWFDALTNYVTAIGYGRDEKEFKKWWPADIHVIGKGISRFHAIFWSAMLLAAGLELPKKLLIHGYVNIEGEKISKSLGNVVSPSDVFERYPTIQKDALRYFLLRYIPTTFDGNFSFEEFEKAYNADLANGLGNLVARLARLCENENFHLDEFEEIKDLNPFVEKYINDSDFVSALSSIWYSDIRWGHIWLNQDQLETKPQAFNNLQLTDQDLNEKKPWTLKDAVEKKALLSLYVINLRRIALNLKPFLPETAEKILKQFSGEIKSREPLFPRIP